MLHRPWPVLLAFPLMAVAAWGGSVFPGESRKLLVTTDNGRMTLDAQTGEMYAAAADTGLCSPDGSRRLVLMPLPGAPYDVEVFLAEGSSPDLVLRQLTDDKGEIRHVEWMSDSSRFLLQRGWTSWIIDLSGERPTATRLGGRDASTSHPVSLPGGQCAYLHFREQRGKESIDDLVLFDGRSPKVLLQGRDLTALAATPDGRTLITSSHGELLLVDVASGQCTAKRFEEIDPSLTAHHADDLAVRPDGTCLAAVIHFSGGRLTMAGTEPTPLAGDRDVFVIPLTGSEPPRRYTFESDVRGVDWPESN